MSKEKISNPSGNGAKLAVIRGFNNPFGHNTVATLMVNAKNNALVELYRGRLMRAIPSTDVGLSMLLTNSKSAEFVNALSMKELELVKQLNLIVSSWRRATMYAGELSVGMPSNTMGLTRLAVDMMGITPDNSEIYQYIITEILEANIQGINSSFSAEAELAAFTTQHSGRVFISGSNALTIIERYLSGIINDKSIKDIVKAIALSAPKAKETDTISTPNSENILSFISDKSSQGMVSESNITTILLMYFSVILSSLFDRGDLSADIDILVLSDAADLVLIAGRIIPAKRRTAILTDLTKAKIETIERMGTAASFSSFYKKGDLTFSIGAASGTKGTSTDEIVAWPELIKTISKQINEGTRDGITNVNRSMAGLADFRSDLNNYFSSQMQTLEVSYANGEDLFRAYKSFMNGLQSCKDVVSARDAINVFTSSTVFRESMAGLLYAMAENEDVIDNVIVNDIMQDVVDKKIMESFNSGPFSNVASIRQIPAIIPDYGLGVGGLSYSINYNIASSVTVDRTNLTKVNDIDLSAVLSHWERPWTNASNKEEYTTLGAQVLSDPNVRRLVRNQAQLCALANDFDLSKNVRDELALAISSITNCVAMQLYVHKVSSDSWFKSILLGLIDMLNYFDNIAKVQDGFVKRHIFFDKAIEKTKDLRNMVTDLLLQLFAYKVTPIDSSALPIFSIKVATVDGGMETSDDPDDIVKTVINMLTNKASYYSLIENLQYYKKMSDRNGVNGLSVKRSNSISQLQSSILSGCAQAITTKAVEATEQTVSLASTLRPNMASINKAMSDAYRDISGVHLTYFFDLDKLLSIITGDGSESVSKDLLSKFGPRAVITGEAPDYVFERLKALGSEKLKKYYIFDDFNQIRMARMFRDMSSTAVSLMKLASGADEGRALGLTPDPYTFVSDSDSKTLANILGAIGLNPTIRVKLNDAKVVAILKASLDTDYPLKLSAKGAKLFEKEGTKTSSSEVLTAVLSDILELKRAFCLNQSALGSFVIYIRNMSIVEMMLSDLVSENFVQGYDIVQVEDFYAKKILGDGADGKAIVISIDEARDIDDIVTTTSVEKALDSIADTLGNYLFPIIAPNSVNLLKEGEEGKEEIEEEEAE